MIIYKTTNLINGKFYVGKDQKNNPEYLGSGMLLGKAIKKYGKDNFKKEILEYCKDKEELATKERYWIDKLDARNKKIAYNIGQGGDGGDNFSGHPNLDSIKKKISNSKIGKEAWNKGKTDLHSKESKKKMSESKIGHIPWNKGLKNVYSDETIKKFSEAKKNKTASIETKDKMSKSHMGRISGMLGKKHSYKSKLKTAKALEKEVLHVINNVIIKSWESPQQANNDLGITIKSIRYFCRKKDVNNKYGLIYKIDYEKNI